MKVPSDRAIWASTQYLAQVAKKFKTKHKGSAPAWSPRDHANAGTRFAHGFTTDSHPKPLLHPISTEPAKAAPIELSDSDGDGGNLDEETDDEEMGQVEPPPKKKVKKTPKKTPAPAKPAPAKPKEVDTYPVYATPHGDGEPPPAQGRR